MRLHQRVFFITTEWEVLEMHDNGMLLKSLNKNVDNIFVSKENERFISPLRVGPTFK